ncbi:hypothetical protein QJS66_06920 [Kocuria rhizophila]|nr:hypothetical protein QJS66_06920 [Kocuria rhizophila]
MAGIALNRNLPGARPDRDLRPPTRAREAGPQRDPGRGPQGLGGGHRLTGGTSLKATGPRRTRRQPRPRGVDEHGGLPWPWPTPPRRSRPPLALTTADHPRRTCRATPTPWPAWTPRGSLAALPAYQSERGIAAHDAGVPLRHQRDGCDLLPDRVDHPAHPRHRRAAAGAGRKYVVVDSLVQAAVVLTVGVLAGGALACWGGTPPAPRRPSS